MLRTGYFRQAPFLISTRSSLCAAPRPSGVFSIPHAAPTTGDQAVPEPLMKLANKHLEELQTQLGRKGN